MNGKPQRITEQDALAILEAFEGWDKAQFMQGTYDGWFKDEGRTLLDKLNEHRKPAAIEWNAQCSCGHRWVFELPTENCPKCRTVTANKAEVPDDIMRDALRYRWLRECDNFPCDEHEAQSYWDHLCELNANDFDEFVDAGMNDSLPPLKDGE